METIFVKRDIAAEISGDIYKICKDFLYNLIL
jgi:hypothetical protein